MKQPTFNDVLQALSEQGPYIEDGISPELQEAAQTICQQAGVTPPEAWGTMTCPCGRPDCQSTLNAGVCRRTDGKVGLFVGKALTKLLSREELVAILSHEIGHVKAGDIDKHRPFTASLVGVRHKQEFAADRFAAKLGHGRALADALQKISDAYGPDAIHVSDAFHPSAADRIARLRKAA